MIDAQLQKIASMHLLYNQDISSRTRSTCGGLQGLSVNSFAVHNVDLPAPAPIWQWLPTTYHHRCANLLGVLSNSQYISVFETLTRAPHMDLEFPTETSSRIKSRKPALFAKNLLTHVVPCGKPKSELAQVGFLPHYLLLFSVVANLLYRLVMLTLLDTNACMWNQTVLRAAEHETQSSLSRGANVVQSQ